MKKTLMLLAASALSAGAFAAGTQTAQLAQDIGSAGTGGNMSVATQICRGTADKALIYGGSGNPISTGAMFIKTGFDVQCSNNVLLQAQEVSANAAAVASGSLKGNQTFAGHSNGGAIVARAKCTGDNDMCLDANVTTAIQAAVAEASSS